MQWVFFNNFYEDLTGFDRDTPFKFKVEIINDFTFILAVPDTPVHTIQHRVSIKIVRKTCWQHYSHPGFKRNYYLLFPTIITW